MAPSKPYSLNGPFVAMVSSPPRVNYVATYSIPTSTDDQFSDVVYHVLGAVEPDPSFMTLMSCDRKNMRTFLSLMSASLKNETKGMRIVPCLVSTSLKNETRNMRIVLLLCQPH